MGLSLRFVQSHGIRAVALHKTLRHYGEIQLDGECAAGATVDHIFRLQRKSQAF